MINHPIEIHHQEVKAQYNKMQEHQNTLDGVREGLDRLTKLGDMIAPSDVVKEAGHIVGRGVGSTAMAEILATMPAAGGQPLQEWVRKNEAVFAGLEQQVAGIRGRLQHHLGVSALRVLAMQHMRASQPPIMGGGGVPP